jgi:hypothetical protein
MPILSTPHTCVFVAALTFAWLFGQPSLQQDAGQTQQSSIEIKFQSPVEGQELPAGQDLVVKFAVQGNLSGESCRVLLLINDRLDGVYHMCKGSVLAVSESLASGYNTIQMLFQTDDEDDENKAIGDIIEPTIRFSVVDRQLWSLTEEEVEAEYCSSNQAHACKSPEQGGCLHQVHGQCFLRASPSDPTLPIPKIFHWVWVGGGGPIPAKFADYMESWRKNHPDWQFIVWTDELITVHNCLIFKYTFVGCC